MATRRVGDALVAAFLRDNVAKPLHVLAKAILLELFSSETDPDLGHWLQEGVEPRLELAVVMARVERLLTDLKRLAGSGEIRLAPNVDEATPPQLVQAALDRYQRFHARTAVERDGDHLRIHDLPLLLFYQNRLEGYGLEGLHGSRPLLSADRTEFV